MIIESNPSINKIIEKMLRVNLALVDGEKFLILSDYPSPKDMIDKPSDMIERILKRNLLAKQIAKIASEKFPNVHTDFFLFECKWKHYPTFDIDFIQKISQYDVIYVISEFSISDTMWLEYIERYAKRAAFSPMSDETIFRDDGPLDINQSKLEEELLTIYAKIKKAEKCRIYNGIGTDIEINVDPNMTGYETGIVDIPGKGSNLPAGEISVGGKLNGTYVVPRGWLEDLDTTLTLTIENNNIKEYKADNEESKWFNKYYLLLNENRKIGQIAFGFNGKADNPFLQIELDKMRGVAIITIAILTNPLEAHSVVSFSGHLPTPNFTMEVDGKIIFKNGHLIP